MWTMQFSETIYYSARSMRWWPPAVSAWAMAWSYIAPGIGRRAEWSLLPFLLVFVAVVCCPCCPCCCSTSGCCTCATSSCTSCSLLFVLPVQFMCGDVSNMIQPPSWNTGNLRFNSLRSSTGTRGILAMYLLLVGSPPGNSQLRGLFLSQEPLHKAFVGQIMKARWVRLLEVATWAISYQLSH